MSSRDLSPQEMYELLYGTSLEAILYLERKTEQLVPIILRLLGGGTVAFLLALVLIQPMYFVVAMLLLWAVPTTMAATWVTISVVKVWQKRPKGEMAFLRLMVLMRRCLVEKKCVNRRTHLHVAKIWICWHLSTWTRQPVAHDVMVLQILLRNYSRALVWPIVAIRSKFSH